MKKALLLTDCSVDLALAVNGWVAAQSDSINLTIVYAFALSSDDTQPLTALAHRTARQQATKDVTQWLNFLSVNWPGKIQTEPLLGDSELVVQIHLLLRHYDYLLSSPEQPEVTSAFVACRNYVATELQNLSILATPIFPPVQRQVMHPW